MKLALDASVLLTVFNQEQKRCHPNPVTLVGQAHAARMPPCRTNPLAPRPAPEGGMEPNGPGLRCRTAAVLGPGGNEPNESYPSPVADTTLAACTVKA